MERHRIGIVIPALNEAGTIASVVQKASQHGIAIVVDDGSADKTSEVARAAGASVVRHEVNCGYEEAIDSGFVCAGQLGCEFVITIDADGQHDPSIITTFIDALKEGADVVIGIRNRRQRLAEHIFAWVAFRKWGIRDPLCGMKAYRMEVYRERGRFDSYKSVGTELAISAAKTGKIIAQRTIAIRERVDEPRYGKAYSANKRILRALWFSLIQRAN